MQAILVCPHSEWAVLPGKQPSFAAAIALAKSEKADRSREQYDYTLRPTLVIELV